ncbi:hypothetical protein O6H91_05G079400 [Diphasiastrum complanatum]|nr:hypothetical protein O6H91_05G079400 [Diphasiastrum complanatum]
MRQAGVIAAAGLISLRDMVGKLKDDHHHAQLLAEGLNAIAGLKVDVANVETNIVNVEVTTDSALGAEDLCEAMKERGVLSIATQGTRIRLVTHYHISNDDVQYVLACFQDTLLKTIAVHRENGI